MSGPWILVAVLGLVTMALKAAGPVLLEGRPLPERALGVVTLLGPGLLAALIAVQTFEGDRSLVVDERVLGVVAAAVALRLRVPTLAVVVIAAVVTGLARAM